MGGQEGELELGPQPHHSGVPSHPGWGGGVGMCSQPVCGDVEAAEYEH